MDQQLTAQLQAQAEGIISSGNDLSRGDMVTMLESVPPLENRNDYISYFLDFFPTFKDKVLEDLLSYS